MINIDNLEKRKKKFDALNGYRGLLAILVLLHHTSYDLKLKGDYDLLKGIGYYAGVIGFFILSAFLLTYRLTIDLEASSNYKEIIKVILKYAIRRFFRIYVPFVLFCLLLKSNQNIFGGYFTNYSPFLTLISLKTVGFNHLWTVGVEIKYYFFIPFICLMYTKFNNYRIYYTILLIFIVFIVEVFNLFLLEEKDFTTQNRHLLLPRLNIFLSGSILGFIYLNYNNYCVKYSSKIVQIVFQIIQFILILYFPYRFLQCLNPKVTLFNDSTKCGIYMTVILFFILICSNEFTINRWLTNSRFLQSCGKYSFGIYLFHPMFIKVNEYIKTKTDFEMIVIIITLSYIAAFIFYWLIEEKSIKLGNFLIKLFIN